VGALLLRLHVVWRIGSGGGAEVSEALSFIVLRATLLPMSSVAQANVNADPRANLHRHLSPSFFPATASPNSDNKKRMCSRKAPFIGATE
jgi:hypothetical protein